MFDPSAYDRPTIAERLRTGAGRRAAGFGLALLLEGLLILLLLSLGRQSELAPKSGPIVSTFDARDAEEPPAPEEKPEEPKPTAQKAPPQPQEQTPPDQPAPPETAPPRAAIIPVSPQRMDTFDIAKLPQERASPAPAKPAMGPPAPSSSANDTPVVGTAPNGQPLYAARWYREPTHQQMAGYLSTAQGPGWGLIACKTAPEYRVEDCVELGEYPQGSNIARAALAASWQFKVLPPRKGNRYLVGEWVRIRVTLEMESRAPGS